MKVCGLTTATCSPLRREVKNMTNPAGITASVAVSSCRASAGRGAAFDATMKDPEFLADAKKLDIDVNPVSGKAIDELLAELYATPKDVIARYNAIVEACETDPSLKIEVA